MRDQVAAGAGDYEYHGGIVLQQTHVSTRRICATSASNLYSMTKVRLERLRRQFAWRTPPTNNSTICPQTAVNPRSGCIARCALYRSHFLKRSARATTATLVEDGDSLLVLRLFQRGCGCEIDAYQLPGKVFEELL